MYGSPKDRDERFAAACWPICTFRPALPAGVGPLPARGPGAPPSGWASAFRHGRIDDGHHLLDVGTG
ncbi:hypothetical protein E2C00_06025 [Streptomyces sp. WAC05374]|uniref:hypothetical protein n=1 Tax=Streptomyces sp. WAC05374 TaxID=2487420 RepID=UPI000F85FD32|nr:hypothetical protein [Streptomyces sp. WAC05374]RST06361.1 hypothetical protein EF905_32350 [Streptomyces sp. WAC05374]TDF44261.1 hypothetical protein E2B92_16220 [Streptomyces sp. WAC05374]TDF53809.1 hypothetical protein E2C02_18675 [Streptomyces sp. WAC05374]TDF58641.1 hypothetical protein E2C00_06025 [Streptomyces sp. WAC05374]